MYMDFADQLAKEFSIRPDYAENIIRLLEEGNTIPFIARYRKELHGAMDDQTLRSFSERLEYLKNLQQRRQEVFSLIEGMGKMTEALAKAIEEAQVLSEVEDLYRPFRPKRKTRASIAREKGLEGLAELLMEQDPARDMEQAAEAFVDPEKGVATVEDALQGAADIIAENISDDAGIRKRLKNIIRLNGSLSSQAADPEQDSVYKNYYDYEEPLSKIANHRVLAINRGEKEGFLKVGIDIPPEKCLTILYRLLVKGEGDACERVKLICQDAYTRLLFPSLEREIRSELTEKADVDSISVFAMNLRGLLMQPPVKGKVTIGLDPGYRTGCKVAVVDATGRVLDTTVIYPTHSREQIKRSKETLLRLISAYHADVLSIGNGTASRETEAFAAEVIAASPRPVSYMIVNEAGASVYSASKLAAQEMPELDLTLRSAVSIARRLQDPLAELVKIEPKAIGVGQYQHDMPQKQLAEALDGVVEDCVNHVGADLNTASPSLLSHIAGISKTVSENIVAYREANGAFHSRSELKKVPKLGPRAFEQCAGFLRVAESADPLDNTGVHPESYKAARELLKVFGFTPDDIAAGRVGALRELVKQRGAAEVAAAIGVGEPTLQDIITELTKPGRDPRDELPPPMLRKDVLDMKDLCEGMVLTGTVRNVIDFGAFVDIGVHQDGLVHISQFGRKVKHPSEVVSVGDMVQVKVLSVDAAKGRISLSMKDL